MAEGAINPFLALAFIPTEIAVLYEYMRYVFIATLAAYTWDWLVSMSQEYMMVKKDGFTFTIVVYFLSRLTTQCFVTLGAVFLIAPLADCNGTLMALSILSVLTCLTTTYLFLLRIRAIFHGNRWIIGVFVLLFIAVNGSAILGPFSIKGGNIPGTQNCITISMHPRTGVYVVIHVVNDILTFFGISWKLVAIQHGERGNLRNLIRGKGFSQLSRVLWSSGQLYFFTTIGLSVVNVVLMLHPKLHPLYHFMLVTANVGLENAMACRIFRQLKFDTGRMYVDTIVQDGSALPYPSTSGRSTSHQRYGNVNHGTGSGVTLDPHAGQGSLPLVFTRGATGPQALQVNVRKHVENDAALGGKSTEY